MRKQQTWKQRSQIIRGKILKLGPNVKIRVVKLYLYNNSDYVQLVGRELCRQRPAVVLCVLDGLPREAYGVSVLSLSDVENYCSDKAIYHALQRAISKAYHPEATSIPTLPQDFKPHEISWVFHNNELRRQLERFAIELFQNEKLSNKDNFNIAISIPHRREDLPLIQFVPR